MQALSSIHTTSLVTEPPSATEWASFFAGLPAPFSGRVKSRETVRSVRILSNEETGGSIAVKFFSSRGVEPAHTHFETKQMFIVLDGELKVWSSREGGEKSEQILRKGDFVFINPGVLHGFSGTALVGGIDIGKGTAKDEFKEGDFPFTPVVWDPQPIVPINHGVVTLQTPAREQRVLVRCTNPNVAVVAETISAASELTLDAQKLLVVVSGSSMIKKESDGQVQRCLPGDYFVVSANETYTVTPNSEVPVVMIYFD